jgi:predicted hydrocarbon binding protein
MRQYEERLERDARAAASVLRAHLSWAAERWPDLAVALKPHLDEATLSVVRRPPLGAADTVLFSDLVRIDRAIATALGGDAEKTYEALGSHSAKVNLAGLYENYDPEEPHRFFDAMSILHRTFQDFGESAYERTGERSGRIEVRRYCEYSPVFCVGGRGYYEEALRMMRVPGPPSVREVACQCCGDPACVFELSW